MSISQLYTNELGKGLNQFLSVKLLLNNEMAENIQDAL